MVAELWRSWDMMLMMMMTMMLMMMTMMMTWIQQPMQWHSPSFQAPTLSVAAHINAMHSNRLRRNVQNHFSAFLEFICKCNKVLEIIVKCSWVELSWEQFGVSSFPAFANCNRIELFGKALLNGAEVNTLLLLTVVPVMMMTMMIIITTITMMMMIGSLPVKTSGQFQIGSPVDSRPRGESEYVPWSCQPSLSLSSLSGSPPSQSLYLVNLSLSSDAISLAPPALQRRIWLCGCCW